MSNYCATCRSNYFKVKDESEFIKWCNHRTLKYWTENSESAPGDDKLYAISTNDMDSSGWPSWEWSEDDMETQSIDLVNELSKHLQSDQIAILQEIGNEKLRYLIGRAVAVDSTGKTVELAISDIYKLAREAFGRSSHISIAEY
jgi:hypothetical protein